MSVDPVALRELLKQGAIKPSGGAIIDVLDARLLTQLGGAQPRRQAFVPPPRSLPVEEQGEPIGVRQILRLAGGGEIGEGLGHSIKAECVKLVQGRMFEQVVFS